MIYLKIISIYLLALVIMPSCQKENEPVSCEESKNAEFIISNSSSDPYDIYIDGNLIYRLQGFMTTEGLTITEGEREAKAIQVSGFENNPLEFVNPIDAIRCEKYIWVIP